MKILDNIATKIADKVNAKNDEVMLLTQENERLQREYDAKAYTLKQIEDKLEDSEINLHNLRLDWDDLDKEYRRLELKYTEVKKRLKDLAESGERQVDTIQDYAEQIIELQEKLGKQSNKDLTKQLNKLRNINANQLDYIEILQVIASAKADKTQLKDVFSHNLKVYLDNNFNTMKQAENKLGINRTTLSELKSGKTALSYDNLDILDSKMCEYFECSVYELITEKMEGKKC